MTQRTPQDAIDAVAIMRADGLTLPEIARLTGVSESTLKRMPTRTRPTRQTIAGTIAGLEAHYEFKSKFVPAAPTMRRLRALARMGWTSPKLSAETGIHAKDLEEIRLGHKAARVRWRTSDRVSDAYDRLWNVDGGSKLVRRAAERRGWLLPLDWDEDTIEDPDYTPEVERDDRYFTRAGRLELVREFRAEGWGPEFIAAELGVQQESLENAARLAEDDDVLRWLQRGGQA